MICAACHNEGGQTKNGQCKECNGTGRMTTGQAKDYEDDQAFNRKLVKIGLILLVAFALVRFVISLHWGVK